MKDVKLIQVHVLERKDKQKPDREVYLGLYPDTPITQLKSKDKIQTTVGNLKEGDVVLYRGEPLKVVWVRPWPGGEDSRWWTNEK